jgi:hypothetical protein
VKILKDLSKIIVYSLAEEQQDIIKRRYGKKYDVLATECFSDVLAIPALLIYIDPKKISVPEMKQLDEVFVEDKDTIIIFTDDLDPKFYEVLGHDIVETFDHMHFYVAKDLETVISLQFIPMHGMSVSEMIHEIEQFPKVVSDTQELLKDIEQTVMPDDDVSLTDKYNVLCNWTRPYRDIHEIVKFNRGLSLGGKKVPFRYEIIDVLLAIKLAYGLISIDDSELKSSESAVGVDRDWVISLAEQLKERKNNSKFLSKI